MTNELIFYVCPLGRFAEQLEAYFALARQQFGHNPAHDYMPHITLTGFFRDESQAIPKYQEAMGRAFNELIAESGPASISVQCLRLDDAFHGYEIESFWLERLIQRFIPYAASATRNEVIRPKDWFHLSLAYQFLPEEHELLAELALQTIDPATEFSFAWELRFYQRVPKNGWICHEIWPL